MTVAPGTFTGFEESSLNEIPGYESNNGSSLVTTAAALHKDGTGVLGGAQALAMSNVQQLALRPRRSDIGWEEVVIEAWWRFTSSGIGYLNLLKNSTWAIGIVRQSDGTLTHRVNNSEQDTTVAIEIPVNTSKMLSSHIMFDSSAGIMASWLDGIQVLNSTGLNTETGGTDANGFHFYMTSQGVMYVDDYGVRPRTLLVTGVTLGEDALTPTAVSGSGETADVYAWENDSADSAGGAGDPTLAPGEWRLYLKNVSFGPEATTGGFVDATSVTVTGLTGPIVCNAPADNYMLGLEPGSQFYYQRLHILKMAVSGVGTENTDGALQGGATDRADALDTQDTKAVRHTATGEKVTLSVTGLSAGEEAVIDEVVGVMVNTLSLTDGGSPSNIKPRLLDNGGSGQNGDSSAMSAADTTAFNFFPLNGSGAQWVKGSGAGGIDSTEPGYETA